MIKEAIRKILFTFIWYSYEKEVAAVCNYQNLFSDEMSSRINN
jgi:hypothetical protein